MMRPLSWAALLLALSLALTASVPFSAALQASDFTDCESCVEHGWGWSWLREKCGGYLNTNCDPNSAEALDEEEEEDFSIPEPQQQQQQPPPPQPQDISIPDPAPIPEEPVEWRNTEETTRLWQLANAGDLRNLANWVYHQPSIVHLRSEDGRGALFWAYEYAKWDMVDFLLERGADPEARDANGMKPEEMTPPGLKRPQ